MRILIVEDEAKTAKALAQELTEEGYETVISRDGAKAVELIVSTPWDAVIMDIMLPGLDGLSAVRQLRERSVSTPVLLLSARGDVNQRIEGLDAGADDYLSKPYSVGEVVARLRALTRRGGEARAILLRVGDLTLDVARRKAARGSRNIDLSTREFRLLEVLMRHGQTPCPRSLLLLQVWDYAFDPGTNLVDVYIRKLREKIDVEGTTPLLHTVRGIGYMISDKEP